MNCRERVVETGFRERETEELGRDRNPRKGDVEAGRQARKIQGGRESELQERCYRARAGGRETGRGQDLPGSYNSPCLASSGYHG